MTRYEFCIDGELTDEARNALVGMQVNVAPVQTLIEGEILDEAHMLGIIAEFRALGITLVSVRPIP